MKKASFDVMGMSCSACSTRVEKAVGKVVGSENVSVNLLTNSMQLKYDEAQTNPAAIIATVEKAGYGAALQGGDNAGAAAAEKPRGNIAKKQMKEMRHRLICSIVFLLPTMFISMHGMFFRAIGSPVPAGIAGILDGPENAVAFAFSQFLLILPIMYLNRKYYVNGFRTFFQGAPNMDSLVGMGSMASALFGAFALFRIGYGLGHGDMSLVMEYSTNLYFESAGMIVTLITVGKYLEARAKGETSQALESLKKLAPRSAHVIRGGDEVTVPIEQLAVGDLIRVRPGERIPADGVITEGAASIDASAITGESIPVEKGRDADVTSATIVQNGNITFRATRVGKDSTISQIIRLVNEASASKAPIARMADKIAGVFVPVVISIAVIVGVIWLLAGASLEFAFSIAIAILVISCPCALGLATPVAIMVGTGKGAENGILIKSGESLEMAHDVDTVVMDKTGTITEGRPRVTEIRAFGMDEDELLAFAAGLEAGSEHPLAEAIMVYGKEKNVTPKPFDNFRAIFGRGVTAELGEKKYFAGNLRLMEENNIPTADVEAELGRLADEGKTPLLFAESDHILGIIAVADRPKATSAEAIRSFEKLGITVVMLTGDNARTAEAVRKELGISRAIAGVLPEDKEKHIAALQKEGHKVAMIGDGVNDAPALVRADLGIAIGAGTDVAIESADAVLMRNDLMDAVNAIRLSKSVIKNIKENLFWAFFYNVICIPLATGAFYPAFGIKLSPMIGAAAMSMSSFCVVMNALRLNFFRVTRTSVPASDAVTDAADTYKERKEESSMEKKLTIEGMMCAHCQKHVHDALAKMDGVTEVSVDLEGGTADVKMSRDIAKDAFAAVIEDAGYTLVSIA